MNISLSEAGQRMCAKWEMLGRCEMASNNSIEDYGNITVLSHVYEVSLSPTATMERDTRIEQEDDAH